MRRGVANDPTKAVAPTSGNRGVDSSPPFVPLEETMGSRTATETSLDGIGETVEPLDKPTEDLATDNMKHAANLQPRFQCKKLNAKKIVMTLLGMFFVLIIYESFFVEPSDRFLQPDFGDRFLGWVQAHPTLGMGALGVVLAVCVVTMVPIGTPLTVGCGYIYRGVYGWHLGLFVATVVSMAGSCLGACICFLLGRYLMREQVQKWVRKYPLFDAIDVASKEQGLKIMAMLYLTPVLPLGLVSYACGTTSMNLGAFALAKVASTPLYLIYTFIGASAHSFIKSGAAETEGGGGIGISAQDQAKQLEENQVVIVGGLVLSLVMMTLITRYIRKELMKILDQQKKDGPVESVDDTEKGDDALEMGVATRRRGTKVDGSD